MNDNLTNLLMANLISAFEDVKSLENILNQILGNAYSSATDKGLIPHIETRLWTSLQALSVYKEDTDENRDIVCDILYSETTDTEKIRALMGEEE